VTQLLISPQEYETLLKALKERIRSAQLQALRSVNSELISLYADIFLQLSIRTNLVRKSYEGRNKSVTKTVEHAHLCLPCGL
jgi:hypothetical protein